MLDWLRNHTLWRAFSELDTLSSLVTCLKVGFAVMMGLVAGFWGWLDSQPGSIQFVLFLSACLIAIWLVNGVVWLRQKRVALPDKIHQQPIVTTSPGTIRAGLYVCDMRFNFADLEKDRHSELTMRVFNGTGRVVEFASLLGQVKFKAPNNTDAERMGTLPTPALRADTTRTVGQLQEWFLILTQRVPATEANKLLAMLAADIPIHFDLRELTIEVFWQDDRSNVERLPIWGGVSYSRGNGFGRIVQAVVNLRV